jgi:hypothetical protein
VRSPFGEVLAALERGLGALGVRWYLFGAQAALLYGSARLTADVDVTVDLGDLDPEKMVAALAAAGFRMRVEGADFVQRTRVLPVLHVPTGIAADIVLAGPGIEELFLDRAAIRDVDGARVPVARPEDIVAMKILASRPKDLDDIVAILAARADLDLDLLRGTLKLLEGALDQSDLLPALEAALVRARGAQPPAPRRPRRRSTPKKKRRPRSP